MWYVYMFINRRANRVLSCSGRTFLVGDEERLFTVTRSRCRLKSVNTRDPSITCRPGTKCCWQEESTVLSRLIVPTPKCQNRAKQNTSTRQVACQCQCVSISARTLFCKLPPACVSFVLCFFTRRKTGKFHGGEDQRNRE